MADNNLQTEKVREWVEEVLKDREDFFLVALKILQANQIKVFVDADRGSTIDSLADINRVLRKKINESELFPGGSFSLEVSSPGLDEPLRLWRQYKKNVGREVEVLLKNGQKKTGILKEVNDEFIVLEYEQRKKKQKKENPAKEPEQFLFNEIKNTRVCVRF